MKRAVQTARAVIGSPWTRVSGTVVGLAILAHSINLPQAVASLGARRSALDRGRARAHHARGRRQRRRMGGAACAPPARPPAPDPEPLLSWRRLSSTYLQGVFFTQMLPAGVGGDAMRTVEMGRQIGHGRVLASLAGSRLAGHARHDLLGDRRGDPAPRAARHRDGDRDRRARRGGRDHLARGAQRRPPRAAPSARPRSPAR